MDTKNTFAIGAVARLLGLSTHALRKWEVRHGAIRPGRSEGGDRRYSRQDLERLSRLKKLVDLGHAISTIASMSDAELDELLAGPQSVFARSDGPLRLAVIGDRLARDINAEAMRLEQTLIVASGESATELGGVTADAVVVEIPSLSEQTREELRSLREQTGIDCVLVVYRYGSIDLAESLSDQSTATFSRPVNYRELERTLHSMSGHLHAPRVPLGLPIHRFSRKRLSDIAMMSPALACECPRHVAELIIELSDFEAYSEQCEISKPDDAVVHRMLRRTAATARSFFEDALVDLAAYEGIEIEGDEL